jgi:hypothetical protein
MLETEADRVGSVVVVWEDGSASVRSSSIRPYIERTSGIKVSASLRLSSAIELLARL